MSDTKTIKFKDAKSLIEGDLSNAIVPPGYVRIDLSTQGKVSKAPAFVYARAMTSAEVLSLSLYVKEELQGPLIGVLDEIILKAEEDKEPVASVADWTPQEVIEFTIKYYTNFFGKDMKDINYIPTKEEKDFLEKNNRKQELTALEKGLWQPKINLDLSKVDFLTLPEKISQRLIVTSKKEKEFSVGFRFPYYGDILIIRDAIKQLEEKGDKQDRTVLIALLSNIILIEKINDTYITKMTTKEKLDMVLNDPKFSISLFDKMNAEFEKINFGVKEDIDIVSPVTKKKLSRRFQFRVLDVLSALTLPDPDGYDVCFE